MSKEPLLSVAVCTHNRSSDLRECLQGLCKQKTTYPYEILVIDNASDDDTTLVVKGLAGQASATIRYTLEPRLGLSFARNRGVRDSRGRYIAFVDDDVIVTDSWVDSIVTGHVMYKADCVAGRMFPRLMGPEPKWLPKWKQVRGNIPIAWGLCDFGELPREMDNQTFLLPGGNMSIGRHVFTTIGLYDERLGRSGKRLLGGEDIEFSRRLHQANLKLFYMPGALVWHKVPAWRTTRRYMARLGWFGGMSSAIMNQRSFGDIVAGVVKAVGLWSIHPELYYFTEVMYRLGWLWGDLRNRLRL